MHVHVNAHTHGEILVHAARTCDAFNSVCLHIPMCTYRPVHRVCWHINIDFPFWKLKFVNIENTPLHLAHAFRVLETSTRHKPKETFKIGASDNHSLFYSLLSRVTCGAAEGHQQQRESQYTRTMYATGVRTHNNVLWRHSESQARDMHTSMHCALWEQWMVCMVRELIVHLSGISQKCCMGARLWVRESDFFFFKFKSFY